MVLRRVIRPAPKQAKIISKVIGWHSFRHSLAINLRAAGTDLKTAQELLRHANSRITRKIYTHAISAIKREANNKIMEMVIETGKGTASVPSAQEAILVQGIKKDAKNFQGLSEPSRIELKLPLRHKLFIFFRLWRGRWGSNSRPLP